jgi:hypothetical protein
MVVAGDEHAMKQRAHNELYWDAERRRQRNDEYSTWIKVRGAWGRGGGG